MNKEHLTREMEIFGVTGENIKNIKLFHNSLKTIKQSMLNTTERTQYWSSLFLKTILKKCLILIIVPSAFGIFLYFRASNCTMEKGLC